MSEYIYKPHELEAQAQKFWADNNTFHVEVDPNKEKFYSLVMFPYPSGELHMGHVRNYTIGDVVARYQRMLGKNVLNPFGWDSFGMPAENAAIAHNTSPAKWTYQNIESMKKTVKQLGFSYDWDREVTTCRPEYYRWEQQFFTRLYEKGIIYRKKSAVNWCEKDKTVLANEQVVDGCCWRCDTPVVQRELDQWFIKISDYAQELLDSLDHMDKWPERVRQMQRNWIGRSEGVEITFEVTNTGKFTVDPALANLKVFTTRPDTFMGVTYCAIAAQHPLALEIAKQDPAVNEFVEKCKAVKTSEADMSTMEKLAFDLGVKVKHPLTQQEVPVYIANFVLMTYGTGAVMSVPSHDERDWEVAQKYNIALKPVIKATDGADWDFSKGAFTDKGVLFNSGEFDGLTSEQAHAAIGNKLKELGKGEFHVNFRLRDWGVSRQRYWGCPIPMVKLADGSIVPVEDKDLPVVLPENVVLGGEVTNPLVHDTAWQTTTYKGQPATRETDTFDTFMESSWYYARYCSPTCDTGMFNKEEADYWLPVDNYVGGIEHAVLHLLYVRFFHKLMRNEGLISACDEPIDQYIPLGMVLNNAWYYVDENSSRVWLKEKEVNIQRDEKGAIVGGTTLDGKHKVIHNGMVKMSKSKNNGVSPKEMLDTYGADAVRLYIMFGAPMEASFEWSESGVEGASRFLRRVWNLSHDVVLGAKEKGFTDLSFNHADLNKEQKEIRRLVHMTIAKVRDDVENRQAYNTAIAAVMELMNSLTKHPLETALDFAVMHEAVESLVLLLQPLTPHITHYLWKLLGRDSVLDFAALPVADKKAMETDTKLIVVQVNGKLRARLELPTAATEEEVKQAALADENVVKFTTEQQVIKVIYVPNKLVNIVVK
ncbi:leucine--tRNA ligase [Psittacicella hinzii]|uniref:Leucine--tRNA ligase n=1 Tax=Psittacicella hinzii TaxID=2028575 RepID=A0A3A1YP92_9GAMM|nr:leucine--tRNA ligase [Psittacicella hinzii]RIY39992.1 leucine--tRNA ligase [Psittacicella hinzii]